MNLGESIRKIRQAKGLSQGEMQKRMQEVTGGLPLPPGLKLF